MANRDALRRLSRKFPPPPEVEKIMDALREGPDMSVAITATSIVEASLERLLTAKLQSHNKSLMGQLFLNRGPLADFHSKILTAEALGAITPVMAKELHSLKAIRNTFAHAKVPISFEHELIAREIVELKMLTAIQQADPDHKLELTNKGWFLLVTKLYLIIFDGIAKRPGTANEALRAMLDEKPPPSFGKF